MRSVAAIVDEQGNVRLLQDVHLTAAHRAVLVILEEEALENVLETALLSEQALAEDWSRPEEDAAWAYLHRAQ